MRTTLDIDEDILIAAKELARAEHKTAGEVVSCLARIGLCNGKSKTKRKFIIRNGIPVFPSTGDIITNELVNKIRDEEGI
jgi:hypothetical protein